MQSYKDFFIQWLWVQNTNCLILELYFQQVIGALVIGGEG